ncbi:RtcB family protein [Clostridium minihomine]|uniref:RtcB family protein n=1 Tax=Clostridium minihomine TaxID=2045012 RepID=UPI000C769EB3|nr:RtcB family protein [Clostridium minihomine]
MIELQGKYNTAKVFTDTVENEAILQIINLLNQEFVSGSKIRIMPDTHAGAGCTIGTTMTIADKVVPNLVGVDIGCGMETVLLEDTHVELQKLDKVIHFYVPAGFSIREKAHPYLHDIDLAALRCVDNVNLNRAKLSLGTLGGGNHFIELDHDDDGRLYLVVHSGSRNLGKQVAEHYQRAAARDLNDKAKEMNKLIADFKRQGRETEIQTELKKLGVRKVDKNLAFCEGQLFDDYLHDMAIVQRYAELNRRAIVQEIVKQMKFKISDSFTTIHNYIDLDAMILRKGAISAKAGERVLIPMNMRDGSLICVGKGNPDWNCSAPHGAGRLMSRSVAKASITLTQFKQSMQGVYSSTVNKSTIDEAPFAYKPMEEIVANIGDTVEIINTIKPLYNFKAAE